MSAEPSSTAECAHLHLHSAYSLTDGLLRTEQLAQACPERGITSVALTDNGNLFGFIGFYKALRAQGVKPICGVEVLLRTAEGSDASLVLLARNDAGYRNLIRLVSMAYRDDKFDGECRLERDWLHGNTEGLTALSCGWRGEIGQYLLNGKRAQAAEQAQRLAQAFDGEFCLEVTRQGRQSENQYLEAAVSLSAQTGLPLVASNDVRFLNREDFEAHEARVCVARKEVLTDSQRERHYTEQQHLLSAAQMASLFNDLPEALANANTLAQRCNLSLQFGKLLLPSSQLDSGGTEEEWIRRQSADGLKARMPGGKVPPEYSERLQTEIEIIERTGFIGYYLVVAEFVTWAKQNDVRVGPGRGSGAGSLVAWALGITDIDPIQYGLLFERFLNPERVSPPDFDIDFEPQGRSRVIEHVVERYGRSAVAQIVTLDVAQARGAVRDAARVLGKPHGLASRICEFVPFDTPLASAMEMQPELREMGNRGGEEREILDLAKQLEGLPRNASRHAGGIVIAPGAVEDYAPLFRAQGEEWLATQYDKKDLESVGLVKFDLLGLTTLRVIDDALEQVNRHREAAGEAPIDRSDMALDDPAPYQLLSRGRTAGIFQLESTRMLPLIQRFAPENFDEVVALLALIRPGPLEAKMFDQAVQCKSGQSNIKPPHDLLYDVVADTWGVMLYQEQVMEAARRLADYSYGEADELRRAMGTKDRDEMARHRSVFVEKAGQKGISGRDAEGVFDKMEHFAGYGFNKSHSAAYALISFQTAWLKAHYPAQFMAASLTQEVAGAADSKRRWVLIKEMQRLGIRMLPPDVNASAWSFLAETMDGETCVRFGICGVSGIGSAPCEAIVKARSQTGAFSDLYDLCLRAGLPRWDVRVLQALNDAGALESLGMSRLQADGQLGQAMQYARQKSEAAEQGQDDLFGGETEADDDSAQLRPQPARAVDLCTPDETARREKQVLGVYLMHHPAAYRRREFEQIGAKPIATALAESAGEEGSSMLLAGRVQNLRPIERASEPMYVLMLEDETGCCEVILREDLPETTLNFLNSDALLLIKARWETRSRGNRLVSSFANGEINSLEQMRQKYATRLVVHVGEEAPTAPPLRAHGNRSGCPVVFRCRFSDVEGDVLTGEQWNVSAAESSLKPFYTAFGAASVWFEYN